MLERAIWVTTDQFEATVPGPHFINPRCFGEDFGKWLEHHLKERGLEVSEPIQEDWGWVIIASMNDRKFTISLGVMDESIGRVPAVWRIGVAYEKPLNSFRTWFKPAPAETLEELFREVQNVLHIEPTFSVSEEEPE